jgi:formylglycine-generating enzyme required for sulfatase activity
MKIKSVLVAAILTAILCISGTVLAVCPSADFTGDCKVNFRDFAILSAAWLSNDTPTANWNQECDISDPNDGVIDKLDIDVFAAEWLTEGIPGSPDSMIWVSINDSGVEDHEGFLGQMSKYETTNAQYCGFLNAALASGDVIVDGNNVKGADGSNAGYDFAGEVYYDLAGPGWTANGATLGGAARINYTGGSFTVDSGFNDHPVTYVTWYGATAFCNYYGYLLPTEWEWRAVADYTGSYVYGCGTSINNDIANYRNSTHPDGTAVVGSFGDSSGYGYGMCDMAGNVYEWTRSKVPGYNFYVIKGGNWEYHYSYCDVSHGSSEYPYYPRYETGFRVCRYNERLVPNVVGIAQSAAETAIMNAELTVGTVTKVCSDTVAEGDVISQSPDAGVLLLLGGPVNLVISLERPDITWVDVNDPGVPEHEGFNGQMSKYTTTNSQYCKFLNDALESGDITIDVGTGNVHGANGTNSGADFVGDIYYDYSSTFCQIGYDAVNEIFSVIPHEGHDMSNYPAGLVSWYGATAFCNYYCYRLPTEWEWQAVADYDGSYIYGCGMTIDHSMANYDNANPIGFIAPPYTTPVDHYPAFGYGFCDFAGNIWEYTGSITTGGSAVGRGSDYINPYTICTVSQRSFTELTVTSADLGFRVCR